MCGILGGWWKKEPDNLNKKVETALDRISQRGPDDRGFDLISSANGTVVLGHTRLSIIDLSKAGHQPMYSVDNRFSMVFNGEIYNYKELRCELIGLGWVFKSNSDSEVLLVAWQQWKDDCLNRLIGMFAFVVYDSVEKVMTCVRDPFGIKPFFYHINVNGELRFASDVNALTCLLDVKPGLHLQRAYDYLVLNDYDSNEFTFFDGVKHLMPGYKIKFDFNKFNVAEPEEWWSPTILENKKISFKDAAQHVREQFLKDIRLQLRSDVAIGVTLSGGIDSSAVVCAMRNIEPDIPINTFSYIAQDKKISEEHWVDLVNTNVNAKSFKVVAGPTELLNDLDDLINSQGEPFGSTSIYAQYKVFKLARENGVTVTLDGQGADELLAGYRGFPLQRLQSIIETDGYVTASRYALEWSSWPGRTKKEGLICLAGASLPFQLRKKAKDIFIAPIKPDWLDCDALSECGVVFHQQVLAPVREYKGRRVVEELMHTIKSTGLTRLLRHGDRNSMRFSVESRVPFLTTEMADLLLSLPESYLVSVKGETKHVFRAAMRGIVPDEILDRKDKIGFATPEEAWLREISPVLREWIKGAVNIPFLKCDQLLEEFDLIFEGNKKFTWQLWRWINFIRWYNSNFK